MKKIFIFILFILLILYRLYQFSICKSYTDIFHYSSSVFAFYDSEFFHNDNSGPFWLIRFFHNKITIFLPLVFHTYLRFWDTVFLVDFLTFVGVFGLVLGIWYICTGKRKKSLFILLGLILVTPFVEIFFSEKLPFLLRLLILWIPLQLTSFYGIKKYLSAKANWKRYILFLLLVVISILWILGLNTSMYSYCIKM